MVRVYPDIDIYKKYPATIVKEVAQKLEDEFFNKRIRARRKGLETVEVNGEKWVVTYQKTNEDEFKMKSMRPALKQESKSMRKEARIRG